MPDEDLDLDYLQSLIDSGTAWRLEGAIGRVAMAALECGACVLPEERHVDFYGNLVPSRYDVVPGTKGSLALHERWKEERDG